MQASSCKCQKKKEKKKKKSIIPHHIQAEKKPSFHTPTKKHQENAGRKEIVTPHTNQTAIRKMQVERPQIRRIESAALRKENPKKKKKNTDALRLLQQ
jgi:hypothetical protein